MKRWIWPNGGGARWCGKMQENTRALMERVASSTLSTAGRNKVLLSLQTGRSGTVAAHRASRIVGQPSTMSTLPSRDSFAASQELGQSTTRVGWSFASVSSAS